jgi:murein DD-endopeptidase MepM/ murein hydrolase activator NlpD
LHKASAALGRIHDRLALLSKTPQDPPRSGDRLDPVAGLRAAAARLSRRDGIERLVPIGLCALLAVAVLLSSLPEVATASGGVVRPTASARLAVVGAAAPAPQFGEGDGPLAADYNDIYLGDGSIPNTLQNPGLGIDAKTLLRKYAVVAGDTLGGIAGRFGLATSTVYWANKAQLPDPGSLRIGQQLVIPPIDGLVVTVGAKDSLASLATKYKISAQDIVDANSLPDTTVAVGQTLIIPGASGGPMPASKVGAPRSASSGSWVWPVKGPWYISQYFWSGHHAIDIAAGSGTPVVAAVRGTVVKVGNNGYLGGGNVIWVMDGPKLYTTYNHLLSWNVRVGQSVGAGQVIGRVGQTGEATGPHLHFEVWLGYPWGLGTVADAVNPCYYLAGC